MSILQTRHARFARLYDERPDLRARLAWIMEYLCARIETNQRKTHA